MPRVAAMAGLLLGAIVSIPWAPSAMAAGGPDVASGQRVYKKANCVGCHKWHGGGGGGYGGAALSLRDTQLDRDQIIEVVRCGRPNTRMPYLDRRGYKELSCYDMAPVDAAPQAAVFLNEREIQAVVDYVTIKLQGKDEPTKEDCMAFWGATSHECRAMK